MHVDGLTLMLAGSFVSGVGSLLLVGAWWQLREATAILWWAVAYLLSGMAIAVLAAGFATGEIPLIAIASAGLPLGAIAIWGGVRALHYRTTRWPVFVAVPAVWLAAAALPFAGGPHIEPVVTTMTLSAMLYAAAAYELWRGRDEKLALRWPMTAILALHASIFLFGIVDVGLGNVPTNDVPPLNSVFSLIHFEWIGFQLASAVFIIMMCRQRLEANYIRAARVDSLTGAANRGAFFVHAERLYRRAAESGGTISAIVFDLDHFKAVNDSYGHAVGDEVIRAFASAARAVLRPGDFFGRIGGEEFAAVLPGAGTEAACVIADRVRHAFEIFPKVYSSATVQATVSAGVATARPDTTLEFMLEAADRALYRAKRSGRNRVERTPDEPSAKASNVIRVA
jgi:diguanylate cyclase (GGDEF)-like protein